MLRRRRQSLRGTPPGPWAGRFAIAILIAAVIPSACDSNESETVRIGVIAPLSGPLTASGLGIRNGVDLAVRQANEQQKVKGWKIVVVPEDDTAVPDVGANAATRLSDDMTVVAVVGPLNSDVAEKVAPILDSQKVVVISPANTDPGLTRVTDPKNTDSKNKARRFPSYFRVSTTDLIHGPFAAQFAYQTVGKRNVAVIHDKTPYGQGLALQFKAHFEKLGGKVLAVETIEPEDKDFSGVLSRIKRLNPGMIYFGGEAPVASLLTSQADQRGLKVPLMGGYGILDPAYIDSAKQWAEGDFATAVVPPIEQLSGATSFLAAYKSAGYADPPEAYGAYAYDAANLIIAAMAKVLPGEGRMTGELRTKLRQAVQDGAIEGVTGKLAFDQYGDRTAHILTVYQVEKDASGALTWKPKETKDFQ